jgi:hypothetical protein
MFGQYKPKVKISARILIFNADKDPDIDKPDKIIQLKDKEIERWELQMMDARFTRQI